MKTITATAPRPLLMRAPHCNACVYYSMGSQCLLHAPAVGPADEDGFTAVWPTVDEFHAGCADGLFMTAWLFEDGLPRSLPRFMDFRAAVLLTQLEHGDTSRNEQGVPLYEIDTNMLSALQAEQRL